MNTLEIEGLTKVYANGTKALNGINLTISNGMFGLLGPNGAGKSSLMRTLAGLQAPTAGNITFNGTDIIAQPEFIRNQLGYLPQEFGVYPKISAYKLLDHIAVLKGVLDSSERKQQVNALLEQTNLYAARKKSVSTFSGGMRQRFGIAQALLGSPQIIIVDEPTAGLDPEERNRFQNLLSEIGENIIIILSTHIVDDVRDLCSNMAIVGQGQVLSQGVPSQLIDALKGKVWSKSINKADVSAFQKAFHVLSAKLHLGKIQLHVLSDARPEEGFELINQDLEDVYFSTLIDNQLITR